MNAEIISVGTELLLGHTVNTDTTIVARALSDLGINLLYACTVGYNEGRLKLALEQALQRSDLVITTGGLGPTKDDLTKEVAASFFGKKLVFHEQTYEHVRKKLESYGINEMTESQKKQALVPEGSLVVTNPAGLAPGIIMAQGDKAIVMLPGPPKEMKAVLAECCHLFINRLSDQVFVSINIKCKGPDELPLREIGEAPVADLLGDILDNENPTVATYAKEDGVLIRVTASGKTREDALTAMQPVVTKIAEILAGKIAWVKEEV
mgnify:CR=1 FL=1